MSFITIGDNDFGPDRFHYLNLRGISVAGSRLAGHWTASSEI